MITLLLEILMKKKLLASFLALGLGLSVHAKDLADTAASAGNLKTLVALLTQAGMLDMLKGPGPYTLFAPTDEALAKLSPVDMYALQREGHAGLKNLLSYHIVPGKVAAAAMAGRLKTVQGAKLTVSTENGLKVDDATLVEKDIAADNGVIHVIDRMVYPH